MLTKYKEDMTRANPETEMTEIKGNQEIQEATQEDHQTENKESKNRREQWFDKGHLSVSAGVCSPALLTKHLIIWDIARWGMTYFKVARCSGSLLVDVLGLT